MLPLSSETPALSLVMTMAVTNVEKQLAYGSSKMNRMILPSTPVPLAQPFPPMSKTKSDQCSLLVVDENVVVVVDIRLVVVVSLAAKGFHLTLGKDVRENETSFIMSRLLIEVLSRLTVFASVVMESVFFNR